MNDNGLIIYRELHEPSKLLEEWLEARHQLDVIEDPRGNSHWFVENDIPRDVDMTLLIVEQTKGFALFDEKGEYKGSYRDLHKAIAAKESAQLKVVAEFNEFDPEEDILDVAT